MLNTSLLLLPSSLIHYLLDHTKIITTITYRDDFVGTIFVVSAITQCSSSVLIFLRRTKMKENNLQ